MSERPFNSLNIPEFKNSHAINRIESVNGYTAGSLSSISGTKHSAFSLFKSQEVRRVIFIDKN